MPETLQSIIKSNIVADLLSKGYYRTTDGKNFDKTQIPLELEKIVDSISTGVSTQLENIGTAATLPLTTRGDIIIRDSTNTTARLGIGESNQVLTSDGIDVKWENVETPVALPLTTRGDILIRDTSNITARLGIGTPNQVLTSDGVDIKWETTDSLPLTTRGDILTRNASNTNVRLGIGSVNQVLTSDGNDITWENAGVGSDSNYVELALKFKSAYHYDTYKEITRVLGEITQIDIWETAEKLTKLFTQTITREGVDITGTYILDEITGKSITSTIFRTDGEISSVVKNYA